MQINNRLSEKIKAMKKKTNFTMTNSTTNFNQLKLQLTTFIFIKGMI